MATFRDDKYYAQEFALRTKLNYWITYKNNILSLNDSEITCDVRRKLEQCNNEIELTIREMNDCGYSGNLKFCQGTQLVNSMLGLLVFPEQQFFERIENCNDWHNLPVLHYLITGGAIYENTYSGEDIDPNPIAILKHLRNCVSHKRIGLRPQTSTPNGREVTHIVMTDYKAKHRFYLKVSIEHFEPLLMEIANFFIHYSDNEFDNQGR